MNVDGRGVESTRSHPATGLDRSLPGRHLVQEVPRPQLALEHGRHGRVEEALHLAMEWRLEPEAEDADQGSALEMAKDLQRVGRDLARDKRLRPALRAEHAPADRREGVPRRLDRSAALEATAELGPEPHCVEEMELEPACDDLARDLRPGVERRECLREEAERVVRVG